MTDDLVSPGRRALLAAGAACALAGPRAVAAETAPVIAWPAIELLDGSRIEPDAWRDTPAVVVFWSTTCPFCKRHNVHVEKLHRALAGRAPRVLGVALDRDAAAVSRYMDSAGYTFPVALDGGRLQRLFSARKIIPLTCLVDRSGRLLKSYPGEMFEEDVMELPLLLDKRAA